MYKQNLHTHTSFCDGKDTPEEMIREAISKGFDSLGFSMHAYVPCSGIGSLEKLEAYKQEILRLKSAYADKIKIYLGLEYDVFATHKAQGYEYTIASVHCLQQKGEVFDFDGDLARAKQVIENYFGGDSMAFARCYYETVAGIPDHGSFDILGHFDLITKNNETGKLMDVQSPRYLGYAKDAIHALKGKLPLFEVNTGGVARGYRSAPYPQMELLQEFKACGFGPVITSDCHKKEFLDFYFSQARELLRSAGFTYAYVLTDSGFAPELLE